MLSSSNIPVYSQMNISSLSVSVFLDKSYKITVLKWNDLMLKGLWVDLSLDEHPRFGPWVFTLGDTHVPCIVWCIDCTGLVLANVTRVQVFHAVLGNWFFALIFVICPRSSAGGIFPHWWSSVNQPTSVNRKAQAYDIVLMIESHVDYGFTGAARFLIFIFDQC